MNRIKKSLINFLNLFLYDENRRKEFEKFNSQMDIYKNMPPDELKFEYILLNAKYEKKKSELTLFLLTIALSVLMNVWDKFFSFMKMAIEYAGKTAGDSVEIAKTSFIISSIIVIFITAVIFFMLFAFINDIHKMKIKIAMIEDVMHLKGAKE